MLVLSQCAVGLPVIDIYRHVPNLVDLVAMLVACVRVVPSKAYTLESSCQDVTSL